jgi:hypothetical protein
VNVPDPKTAGAQPATAAVAPNGQIVAPATAAPPAGVQPPAAAPPP